MTCNDPNNITNDDPNITTNSDPNNHKELTPTIHKHDKDTIRITILDTDGKKSEFEVRKSAPLKKLLNKYCEIKMKNPDSVILTHMNLPMDMTKSMKELGIVDNTVLSVMGRQAGG